METGHQFIFGSVKWKWSKWSLKTYLKIFEKFCARKWNAINEKKINVYLIVVKKAFLNDKLNAKLRKEFKFVSFVYY